VEEKIFWVERGSEQGHSYIFTKPSLNGMHGVCHWTLVGGLEHHEEEREKLAESDALG
jgi:hypothetical protein